MRLRFGIFIKEGIFFAGTMALGIWVSARQVASFPAPLVHQAPFSWIQVGIALLCGIGMFMVLNRFPRARTLFLFIFFGLTVLVGGQVVVQSFAPSEYAFAIVMLLLVSVFVIRNILIHNIAMMVSIVGVSVVIGIGIDPSLAVMLLAVFSIYDVCAVYWTRHMVSMARGMIESGIVFGFIVPHEARGFIERRPDLQAGIGTQFMILGSGDIGLPLILIASIAAVSWQHAAIIAGCACVGLLVTHILFVNQRRQQAMAALPPIALATILGYAIVTILL